MDRFALPEDRRDSCHACGSERREYLTECAVCEAAICSVCRIEERDDAWSTFTVDLCRSCALKELNAQLTPLVPVCTCEDWPSWVNYGHQLTIMEAVA